MTCQGRTHRSNRPTETGFESNKSKYWEKVGEKSSFLVLELNQGSALASDGDVMIETTFRKNHHYFRLIPGVRI